MYQLGHVFLWCDIPTVPLEYITGAEIFPVNEQLHCRNYKWQLQSSHNQAVYVRIINGNHISVAYIRLNFISIRYLGFTYEDT